MRFPISRDSEQGFTLVEILVVVLILGVLASVSVPAFLNQRRASQEATVKSDLKNAATQIEGAYQQSTGYPSVTSLSPQLSDSETVLTNLPSLGGNAESFCIKATNPNLPDTQWFYGSLSGGLSNNPGGCVVEPEETDPVTNNGFCLMAEEKQYLRLLAEYEIDDSDLDIRALNNRFSADPGSFANYAEYDGMASAFTTETRNAFYAFEDNLALNPDLEKKVYDHDSAVWAWIYENSSEWTDMRQAWDPYYEESRKNFTYDAATKTATYNDLPTVTAMQAEYAAAHLRWVESMEALPTCGAGDTIPGVA